MKAPTGPLLLGISGGAIGGALLRHLIQQAWNTALTHPYGTLVINALGSLLIGFFTGFFSQRSESILYYAVATGFCGSFTTFSSVSLEVFEMLLIGQFWRAFIYLGFSLALGLIGVSAGWWLGVQLRG